MVETLRIGIWRNLVPMRGTMHAMDLHSTTKLMEIYFVKDNVQDDLQESNRNHFA
jgi:hypothetical protein